MANFNHPIKLFNMALTGRIIFNSYSFPNSQDTNSGAMGRAHSIPSAMARMTNTQPNTVGGPANSITLLTAITMFPTGLNQKGIVYYTADSIATLQTNGN